MTDPELIDTFLVSTSTITYVSKDDYATDRPRTVTLEVFLDPEVIEGEIVVTRSEPVVIVNPAGIYTLEQARKHAAAILEMIEIGESWR